MFVETILYDNFTIVSLYDKLKKAFPQEYIFLLDSADESFSNQSIMSFSYCERVFHKDNKSFYEYISEDNSEKKIIEQVDDNPLIFLQKKYKKIDATYYEKESKKYNIPFIDGFVGYLGFDIAKEFTKKLKKSYQNLKDETNINDLELVRPKVILTYNKKTFNLSISCDKKYELYAKNLIQTIKGFTYKEIEIKKIPKNIKINYKYSKKELFEILDICKEKIIDGDIFQILISNRVTINETIDPLSFYRILKTINPSPYMYLLNFLDFTIVGSSPEKMIELTGNDASLKPLAGTRKRGKNDEEDKALIKELLQDKKEISEHIMLVDLGRNDLGRVAKTGTVKVKSLMGVEKYSHVMHIVSELKATIGNNYDMFDLFMATFSAGTMTGTPKIRAMELIAELEKTKRSFYSGVVGYFGFDGNMNNAIAIRTALFKKDKAFFQAGAGIVADSQKEIEFLEIENKLKAMITTLNALKIS